MRMVLYTEPELCTGCASCMLVCSFVKEGGFGLTHSRLKVARDEGRGVFAPIVCKQCTSAPCAEVCPVDAIQRTEDGILVVDEQECIGCFECATACPFGVIAVSDGRPLKCDLCGGDPRCVQVCHCGALQFTREDRVGQARTKEILESHASRQESTEGE